MRAIFIASTFGNGPEHACDPIYAAAGGMAHPHAPRAPSSLYGFVKNQSHSDFLLYGLQLVGFPSWRLPLHVLPAQGFFVNFEDNFKWAFAGVYGLNIDSKRRLL